MREIKFRGLTIQSHMWECGDLIKDRNGKCFIHFYDCNGFECSYEVIPETIGQYTGLKDKNGKEIYEGDILACGDGKVSTEIKWVQKSSAFMGYNIMRDEYHLLNEYFKRFIGEIIGNIHENPELLKGE